MGGFHDLTQLIESGKEKTAEETTKTQKNPKLTLVLLLKVP